MRVVPPGMVTAFYSGDFTGDNRNIARVTVQQGGTKLFQLPYNLYASYVFGSDYIPRELPNVKSVEWQRGTDSDFATATITFYNTAPMPTGTIPTRDLDRPGYYTYNHGTGQFVQRWGTSVNEWSGVLMPDNVLRTYEGYGFDRDNIPEMDENLVSTGTWRIDDVDYNTQGLIVVTCRDVGSILQDQILFAPIVPKKFWPPMFSASSKAIGFVGPSVSTSTQDTADVTQPSSWHGPVDGPATLTATAGNGQISVAWTRPSTPNTPGGDTTKGYKVTGYQLALDGVILPAVYGATRTSAVLKGAQGIHNGNVYSVRAIAIWKEVLTKKGEVYFKTNVEKSVRSNFSIERIARPNTGSSPPTVTAGSIAINVNEANGLAPGYVRFGYSGAGTYVVIAYKADRSVPYKKWTVDLTGSGTSHVATGTALGDLTTWNFLAYGRNSAGTVVGPGDVFFASSNGAYYGAPDAGVSPPASPTQPTPSVTTTTSTNPTGTSSTTVPLKDVKVEFGYSDSSNTPYVGAGEHVGVYGHTPYDGLHRDGEYWLSIGNDVNTAGYSFEWLEGSCNKVTLTGIVLHTKLAKYGVYVSVHADGKWVQHSDTGIIPYNANLPESHNHANIPYCEFKQMGKDEGPITISFRKPIDKVAKVRVTFHNLQYFDVGDLHYRAGVRYVRGCGASGGTSSGSGSGGGGTTTTVNPPVVGSTQGGSNSDVSSVTTYTPAHIIPGLGANPGLYQDYTDIIKLFCAWAGFYWQNGAYRVFSDGSEQPYSWGSVDYGLPNVDPVLGDVDSGRVWGDFEQTGTTGIVPLPADEFSMKSLMDGIAYIRDIVGFIFYVDEDGAVVWRRPNIFAIGNWIGDDASADVPARVTNCVVLDERTVLVDLHAKLSGRNVRERFFVASTDGKNTGLAAGYNPNPTGLRRVAGWTDQHFGSDEECQLMADLIALRGLFQYRSDTVTIHGYPAIQVDDQVIIVEQVTSDGYYHYVNGISSHNDMENPDGWTYDLTTYWLGERPFDVWAFNPADLSQELQTYVDALTFGIDEAVTLPDGSV